MPDPTAPEPMMAEGSYDWWRAEVARRDEEMERLRAELDRLQITNRALDAAAIEALERAERAEAERDALKAATERAKERHPRDDSNPRGPWCPTCLTVWPCPTLAALGAPEIPGDPAGATANYIHITYGPWDSSGHQCGDLDVGGCDEPVPSRLVTVHYAIDSEQVIGSELGDCPNRCLAALAAPESNAPARTPVTAATEAHGEAGEAQEARE